MVKYARKGTSCHAQIEEWIPGLGKSGIMDLSVRHSAGLLLCNVHVDKITKLEIGLEHAKERPDL